MFIGSKFSHLVTGTDFSCGNVLNTQDSVVALFLALCFLRIRVRCSVAGCILVLKVELAS